MACCLFSLKILLLTYDSTLMRDEESTDKTYGSRNPTVDRVDHTHDQAHYSTIVVTLVGQEASGQNSITCIAGQKLRQMAANFEEGTGTVYAYAAASMAWEMLFTSSNQLTIDGSYSRWVHDIMPSAAP